MFIKKSKNFFISNTCSAQVYVERFTYYIILIFIADEFM